MKHVEKQLFFILTLTVCVLFSCSWTPEAVAADDSDDTEVPTGFKRITGTEDKPGLSNSPDSVIIPPKAPSVPGVPNVNRNMRKRIEQRIEAIKKRVDPNRFRPPRWEDIVPSVKSKKVSSILESGARLPKTPASAKETLWSNMPPEVQNLFSPKTLSSTDLSKTNLLLMPSLINLWAGNQYIPRSFYLPGK